MAEQGPNVMDASDVVEQRWSWLRSHALADHPYLLPLLDAVASVPVLRSLFPFLSIGRLCFSRCTEFPYFVDVLISFRGPDYVAAATVGNGGWVETIELGAGTAREMTALLAAHISPGYGPALLGPADEHRRNEWLEARSRQPIY